MKKIFTKLMLLAVAAAALVSCENNYDESTPVVELTQTVTLSADKTAVRTELIEGVPYWSAEDQIGVYYATGVDGEGKTTYENKAFTNDNKEGASLTTSFTGTTAVVNTLFVYYPYVAGNDVINDKGVVKATLPTTQQPTVASFDGAADIMIAKPVTLDEEREQLNNLEFARLGAIVKIVLKGKDEDNIDKLADQHVSSLTMTATTNLTGKVYLDVINQELGTLYSNQAKSVTANYTPATTYAIDGTNATYVVVYPQTLAAGADSKLSFEAVTEGYNIKKEIPITADKFPNGIILESGKVTTLNVSLDATNLEEIETIEWVNNAYNLVPNITGLEVGDKVVIAANGYDMALSTTQNSNNRAATAITKNENKTIEIDSNVEVLTVEAGNIEGTFAFKTSDNKYLYAAATGSNYLRSEANLSNNSSFLVTITDGVASAVAQGTNTNNKLFYNNSSKIFSCYANAQQAISIYKLVGEYVVKDPAITLSIADVTVEHDATSGEANVTATNGDGWTITAETEAIWVKNLNYAEGKITFTTEKNEDEARSATVTVTATKADYDNVTATFKISQNAKPAEGGPTTVVDVLTRDWTGSTSTSYVEWSGKTSNSTAVYKGKTAGGNSAIQFNTNNNSTIGIVTTASGGTVRKVVVTWQSSTSDGRTLEIYGKNTAYSAATELYNNTNKGTKLGSIVKGTSTELVIDGNYQFIGLRSNSGAMYITEIQITWESGEGGGSTPEPEPATPVWGTVTAPAEVAAAGGSASISYSVTDAVEGKFASATTTATWITGFTCTADKVTFNVAANTGAAREATVTLSYEGITETKNVTVKQAAGESTGGDEGGEATPETKTISFTGGSGSNQSTISFTSVSPLSCVITANGNQTSPRLDSNMVRMYASGGKSNKMTITTTSSPKKKITKVVVTATSSSYATALGGGSATVDSGASVSIATSGSTVTYTITGNTETIEILTSGQARLSKVDVTYQD